MPITNQKRKKQRTVPNISQRSTGTTVTSTSKAPSAIPPNQYITPRREASPTQTPQPQTPQTPFDGVPQPSRPSSDVRNFPPPINLFPGTSSHPSQPSHPSQANGVSSSSPSHNVSESPLQNSHAASHPSSHGNNFEDEDEDEAPLFIPELSDDTQRAINLLLSVPDRHKFVPLLSPNPKTPNSTW